VLVSAAGAVAAVFVVVIALSFAVTIVVAAAAIVCHCLHREIFIIHGLFGCWLRWHCVNAHCNRKAKKLIIYVFYN